MLGGIDRDDWRELGRALGWFALWVFGIGIVPVYGLSYALERRHASPPGPCQRAVPVREPGLVRCPDPRHVVEADDRSLVCRCNPS